jgi:hypothetical protein
MREARLPHRKPALSEVESCFADYYPSKVHNKSMNHDQSRRLSLTTDHCSLNTVLGTPYLL